MVMPDPKRKFSYRDYATWAEEKRIEIVGGEPYDMTPAPSRKHQYTSKQLFAALNDYLSGDPCEAYYAPFDVRLFAEDRADDQVFDVVQPDLVVVCDPDKLDDAGCKGSPDVIIEIVSPSSIKMDKKVKRHLYEKAGIKEYWIIDPIHAYIEVYTLENEKYGKPLFYSKEDHLKSALFKDLKIDLEYIFE
ncbi:Uma2 family endonuclease [Salicibibacter cibarius]|uniref:Uma2 family endonuclease n=1 Tax=Salicibibacter cibarius TaxID=2743000 RepID=A0A7T6Z1Z0_9BACI|nr:Uma2 family endonuclease [Salicibibacter cibarius]QQK75308.1 Uma2 family endonuclease [Salicibibacter cibarius]